jgi:hypothetical protein
MTVFMLKKKTKTTTLFLLIDIKVWGKFYPVAFWGEGDDRGLLPLVP